MTLTPKALVMLHVQRHHLHDQPHEREIARECLRHLEAARSAGHLVTLVQWDGDAGSEHETFSKGWTLYPDFRAEAGELLIRARQPDAFSGSELDASLRARAVRELELVALDCAELRATAHTAKDLGYEVTCQVLTPKETV